MNKIVLLTIFALGVIMAGSGCAPEENSTAQEVTIAVDLSKISSEAELREAVGARPQDRINMPDGTVIGPDTANIPKSTYISKVSGNNTVVMKLPYGTDMSRDANSGEYYQLYLVIKQLAKAASEDLSHSRLKRASVKNWSILCDDSLEIVIYEHHNVRYFASGYSDSQLYFSFPYEMVGKKSKWLTAEYNGTKGLVYFRNSDGDLLHEEKKQLTLQEVCTIIQYGTNQFGKYTEALVTN